MLVPQMLRERLPDANIGFFLHIPFPSSEVFSVLPWREEILGGLLGADLIGFHTPPYLRHFATSLRRVLGMDVDVDRVLCEGREVRLGVFPMGVDATAWEKRAQDPDVLARVEEIRGDEQRPQDPAQHRPPRLHEGHRRAGCWRSSACSRWIPTFARRSA